MRFDYQGHANEGGLYRILNLVNGRVYIGSTCQFKVRWRAHRRQLETGVHHNQFLQRDFDKCGSDAFVFEVLAVIPVKSERTLAEGEAIRGSFGDGCYNLKTEVIIPLLLSEVTREKMRNSQLGQTHPNRKRPPPMSAETRARIGAASASRVRKPHSEETKQKIRQTKMGHRLPADVVDRRNAAIRAAYGDPELNRTRFEDRSRAQKGVPRSEAVKQKIRAAWHRRKIVLQPPKTSENP